MKKSKWAPLARFMIVLFLIVLFFNIYSFFVEVRRDVLYGSRSYGLSTLNDDFDDGNYEQIYVRALANRYADDELSADTSQYEAFGFYYHNYVMALTHEDNAVYLKNMAEYKSQITWKKILSVIEKLESDMSRY